MWLLKEANTIQSIGKKKKKTTTANAIHAKNPLGSTNRLVVS
jgi:hypothetical protein